MTNFDISAHPRARNGKFIAKNAGKPVARLGMNEVLDKINNFDVSMATDRDVVQTVRALRSGIYPHR
ncbi:hypothetical protein [Actinomyces vulturis]|uniref:hypothetical protein n=1 Tax=Actinomyces vulturis TaxID=1857645 RepID=UPI001146C7AC|nr:hypothetical protein [Actinomyces vulturis]